MTRSCSGNAEELKLNECQFADDAALLATTKRGAEMHMATSEYMRVAKDFGLTLSIPKNKGHGSRKRLEVTIEDRTPLSVGGEEIEAVTEFPYLWSQMESSGRMTLDVEKRVAQASKAFRALRKPVLSDNDLNTVTKRKVYLCPPVRIRVLDAVEKIPQKA